jgi:hypothetical protein
MSSDMDRVSIALAQMLQDIDDKEILVDDLEHKYARLVELNDSETAEMIRLTKRIEYEHDQLRYFRIALVGVHRTVYHVEDDTFGTDESKE